jgi:hypothetical protein
MSTELPGFFKELQAVTERFEQLGLLANSGTRPMIPPDQIPQVPVETTAPPFDKVPEGVPNLGSTIFYPETTRWFAERIMPNLSLKPILQDFSIRVGTTATIPKEVGTRVFAIEGKTAYGKPCVNDYTQRSSISICPYKIGIRVRINRETIEDEIVSIVEDQYRRVAKRVVLTIEGDVASCLDIATQKKLAWLPGRRYPSLKSALDRIRTPSYYTLYISESAKWPNVTIPTDLKVVASGVLPTNVGYLIRTAWPNCYAPIGYFVMKRPLAIDMWAQPNYDAIDVIITTRYAPVITYPEAIQRVRL